MNAGTNEQIKQHTNKHIIQYIYTYTYICIHTHIRTLTYLVMFYSWSCSRPCSLGTMRAGANFLCYARRRVVDHLGRTCRKGLHFKPSTLNSRFAHTNLCMEVRRSLQTGCMLGKRSHKYFFHPRYPRRPSVPHLPHTYISMYISLHIFIYTYV